MEIHHLKTWTEFFKETIEGRKTFEFRKNDRNFQVGDILILEEYDPTTERYTGMLAKYIVCYILDHSKGAPIGLPQDHVIMSIKLFETIVPRI